MEVYEALGGWLHDKTGIPIGVIKKLSTADDWTFIITIHAVMESLLNSALTQKLGYPELSDIITKFETGDLKRGKLAWTKALGMLSDDMRQFIRVISELRNKLVHNIDQFEFSIQSWISEMPDKLFNNLVTYLRGMLESKITVGGKPMDLAHVLKLNPREIIFSALVVIIIRNQTPASGEPVPWLDLPTTTE